MINIPIFQPLDLPPDISYEISDCGNFYIFTKNRADNSRQQFIISMNNLTNKLECYDFIDKEISQNRIFLSLEYEKNNMNELLWKISEYNYSFRYLRLELIERVRKITNEHNIKDVLECLKKYNKDYPNTDSEEED